MKLRIKINGIVILSALLVFAVFFYRITRHASGPADEILEIAGMAAILLGQLLRASARGYKADRSRNGNALVCDGPYVLVRNPMYLGILLIGTGVVLVVFPWWVFIVFLGAFASLYIHPIFKEEKELRSAFGQHYATYMKQAPRLLPRPGFLLRHDISEYLPMKLGWFRPELLSVVLVWAGVLGVEVWEELHLQSPALHRPH